MLAYQPKRYLTMSTIKPAKVRHAALVSTMALLAAPALIATVTAADAGKSFARPTAESALAADQELATAIRENDADAIASKLSDDWAVIDTYGGIGEGKSIFPQGIKSGYLRRKTYELSSPRVKIYGNVALVTTKVRTSGTFAGKPFDVMERQTDVLVWHDGNWKVVLTQETKMHGT
jgi:ketosteroid isomerase-like protein